MPSPILRRPRALPLLLGLLAFLAIPGCEDPKDRIQATVQRSDGLTGGRLVFEDTFERAELGGDWKNVSGRWRIQDGWVTVQDDHNDGLWLLKELPEKVRVELDAMSVTDDGDLKCEIFAARPEHQAGYVVIFGGWKNRINTIARLDEHGEDRLEETNRRVVKGKAHHFTLVRSGAALRWYVDGELLLTFDDAQPLKGRYFGLNDWEAPVRFDNLRVYALDDDR